MSDTVYVIEVYTYDDNKRVIDQHEIAGNNFYLNKDDAVKEIMNKFLNEVLYQTVDELIVNRLFFSEIVNMLNYIKENYPELIDKIPETTIEKINQRYIRPKNIAERSVIARAAVKRSRDSDNRSKGGGPDNRSKGGLIFPENFETAIEREILYVAFQDKDLSDEQFDKMMRIYLLTRLDQGFEIEINNKHYSIQQLNLK